MTQEEAEAQLNAAMDAVKAALPKAIAAVIVMAVREYPEAKATWGNTGRGPLIELLTHGIERILAAPEPPIVGQG